MAQSNRADDHARATDSELYLPAGSDPSFLTSRLEWIWTKLFNHGVETST